MIGRRDLCGSEVDLQWQVSAECDQLSADQGEVTAGGQILLQGLTADGRDIVEYSIEGLVLIQQRGGGFGTDFGDTWHIIDGVSDERLKVDDLIGSDAPVIEQ
ncbi:MAG TPA: hypothetical protein DIT89_11555 [Planctomycetaceae bacterium]|nr:hypothetical protein [Planctomycetaceae bacterium]